MFIWYIFRLHTTFKESMYRLSKLTIIVLISLLCIELTIKIGWEISSVSSNLRTFWIMVTIQFGIDVIFGIAMIYLFNRKLFLLALLKSRFKADIQSNYSIEFDQYQQRLIHLSTKLIILGSIAIISTLIASITFLIVIYNTEYSSAVADVDSFEELSKHAIWDINWWAFICDPFINTLCIFMQFGANKRLYHCLCGCCHDKCLQCCINFGKISIKNNSTQQKNQGTYLQMS